MYDLKEWARCLIKHIYVVRIAEMKLQGLQLFFINLSGLLNKRFGQFFANFNPENNYSIVIHETAFKKTLSRRTDNWS